MHTMIPWLLSRNGIRRETTLLTSTSALLWQGLLKFLACVGSPLRCLTSDSAHGTMHRRGGIRDDLQEWLRVGV